jgi:hypothetical protein
VLWTFLCAADRWRAPVLGCVAVRVSARTRHLLPSTPLSYCSITTNIKWEVTCILEAWK